MSDDKVVEPLSFVETVNQFVFPPIPILIAVNEILKRRPLWQEGDAPDNSQDEMEADDVEIEKTEAEATNDVQLTETEADIKLETNVQEAHSKIEGYGECCERELSGKAEESNQPKDDKPEELQVLHESTPASD